MSKPSTSIGNEHLGKTLVHPILLVRPVTLPVGSELTHHLMNGICEPSSLLDTQEVVDILLSELFRIVVFI